MATRIMVGLVLVITTTGRRRRHRDITIVGNRHRRDIEKSTGLRGCQASRSVFRQRLIKVTGAGVMMMQYANGAQDLSGKLYSSGTHKGYRDGSNQRGAG
jgi:hypothetical protein